MKAVEVNTFRSRLAAIYINHTKWDLAIVFLAAFIASAQFFQKTSFLVELAGEPLDSVSMLFVLAVNFCCYLAIVCWAWLLLVNNKGIFLRVYVVFVGLLFSSLNRIVESGEESTRQGVDFELVSHLMLALIGHGGWQESVFVFCFKYGLFILLGFGIVYKILKNNASEFPLKTFVVFLACLAISFYVPASEQLPYSMRINGLVHVVKTAWFPVPDIRPDTRSDFRFGELASIQRAPHEYQNKPDYFQVADGKNIVVIALESTSANMLDFYQGNDAFAGSTPFMSEWSKTGVLIHEASAVMNSTSKSLVSILCGIEPYLKTEVFEVTLGIPVECLPARLKTKGYDTIFFQSATQYYEGRDQLVEHAGFENFISIDQLPEAEKQGMQSIGPLGLEDKVMLPAHQRWLRGRETKQQPFFAFYMTLAQHHPYLPPGFDESFKSYAPDNRYMNDFVNSLSYVDAYIESIVSQYKEAGLYDETVFVVVGDHGEGFGRYHRPWFHNNVLYREGSWVPFFIINESIWQEREVLEGQFSLLDVAPTIEHLAGLSEPNAYRGQVVFQSDKSRTLFSSCWYKNRCVSAYNDKFKFIYNYGDMPDELYLRQGDFREQNNVIQDYPQVADSMKDDVFTWYHDVLSAYEHYFISVNPEYVDDPEAYYQFPSEILPNKSEVERW